MRVSLFQWSVLCYMIINAFIKNAFYIVLFIKVINAF